MAAEMSPEGDVTRLLHQMRDGRGDALGEVIPIVYQELRRIAHRQLAGERLGRTLGTTGLVHEAFLKLVDLERIQWQDRAHFLAISARLMRRILIDYALEQRAQKRGRGATPLPLDEMERNIGSGSELALDPETMISLDAALTRLAERSQRQSRVVECRFFAGMDVRETAEALAVSQATVKRDWAVARAWLNMELAS